MFVLAKNSHTHFTPVIFNWVDTKMSADNGQNDFQFSEDKNKRQIL